MKTKFTNLYIICYLIASALFPEIIKGINVGGGYIGPRVSALVSGIASAVMILVLYFALNRNFSHFRNSYLKQPTFKGIIQCVPLGAFVWLGGTFLSFLINYQLGRLGIQPAPQLEATDHMPALMVDFLNVCLAAPLFEELIFRGILPEAYSKYGAGFSAAVAVLLFTLAHGSITIVGLPLFMGLVCMYTAKKTGCIFYGMIIHSVSNAISFYMSTVPQISIEMSYIILAAGALSVVIAAVKLAVAVRGKNILNDTLVFFKFIPNILSMLAVVSYYILLNMRQFS